MAITFYGLLYHWCGRSAESVSPRLIELRTAVFENINSLLQLPPVLAIRSVHLVQSQLWRTASGSRSGRRHSIFICRQTCKHQTCSNRDHLFLHEHAAPVGRDLSTISVWCEDLLGSDRVPPQPQITAWNERKGPSKCRYCPRPVSICGGRAQLKPACALVGRLGELFINLRDSKGYAVETARLASALGNCPVLDCLPPPMASCASLVANPPRPVAT